MTQIQQYSIKCQCGNIVNITLHQSVNVTVDPDLMDLVKTRKINNYYCEECGATSELAFQFLFVDNKKGQYIWCYPDKVKAQKEEIQKEIDNNPGNNFLMKITNNKQILVFGYDELFHEADINCMPKPI